ncbi:BCCT family transporter [Acetobacterium sp.]|uniref:BCCT family transporter n=1 Tax=Acetobacterium sp. TaxID=1872094 RepID=UPI003593AB9D
MNKPDKATADKTMIGIVLVFVSIVCLCLFIAPDYSKASIQSMNYFITSNLGFIYIWIVLISIVLCLYLGAGQYGSIQLGAGKKEYSEFSWASMMFCASMAAGFIYWGSIEWVFHYMEPPFDIAPLSTTAAEYAATLPLFYWGFSAWSVYLIPAVVFAFVHYNLKQEKFDVSNACRPILGDRVDGLLGKFINIFFLFGIIGGVGTALGIGSPLVSACLNKLFGWEDTNLLRFGVMVLVTVIFTISAYNGIKKGIKILSDINVFLMLAAVLFLFITGNTVFFLKMQTTSLGILLSQFVKMSTYMDPINNSGYTESWTVFYWAWWMSYSLFMGLFIAKISKGRSIKQVIFGGLGYGFMGSFTFFSIFGNYFMEQQLSGTYDVVKGVLENGGPTTVVDIFSKAPFGLILVFVILITSIISMATNFDSAAYTMAMVSSKKIQLGQRPGKKLTIFWALCLAAIPMTLMIFGGSLIELQTLSIILALPTCAIYIVLVLSCFKLLKEYVTNTSK